MGHEVLEAFESRPGHHPFAPFLSVWASTVSLFFGFRAARRVMSLEFGDPLYLKKVVVRVPGNSEGVKCLEEAFMALEAQGLLWPDWA